MEVRGDRRGGLSGRTCYHRLTNRSTLANDPLALDQALFDVPGDVPHAGFRDMNPQPGPSSFQWPSGKKWMGRYVA